MTWTGETLETWHLDIVPRAGDFVWIGGVLTRQLLKVEAVSWWASRSVVVWVRSTDEGDTAARLIEKAGAP